MFDQTLADPQEHLEKVFRSFLNDPADTPFQLGYLHGLVNMYIECFGKSDLVKQVSKQLEMGD